MKPNASDSKVSRTAVYIVVIFALATVGALSIAVGWTNKVDSAKEKATRSSDLSEEQTDNNLETRARGRHLETKLAVLNARQNNLEDDVSRLKDQIAADTGADESKTQAAPASEERAQQAEQHYQDQIALLAETLAKERVDPAWSENADNKINEKFMETGVLRSLKSQCQSTLCKIDMEFVNENQSFQDFSIVGRNLPWNGQIFVKIDSNGKQGTVYLAREGHELPRLEM